MSRRTKSLRPVGGMIDFGMQPGEFAERFFEQRHFLQKAALRKPAFGWSELDSVLHQIEPTAPAFQMFNDGLVDEDRYTDHAVEFGAPRRRLNKHRFFGELYRGATLVVNKIEKYSLPIRRMCTEVGRFARSLPVSNAYLSLGGEGTFGKHWDTHDVFALQLIGRKRWQVFEPTCRLPLSRHTSSGREQQCPAEPILDVILEAGDLLYLPRGFWHQALPLREPSLHLSVGTYGPSVHDYLMWVCANRLVDVPAARRSLGAQPRASELAAVVEQLGQLALEQASMKAFEGQVQGRDKQICEFNTELFFSSGPAGLSADAIVSLNGYRAPQIEAGQVLVNGVKLTMNATCLAVIDALTARPSLDVQALCEALSNTDLDTVRMAVLDLELHEIVTIVMP